MFTTKYRPKRLQDFIGDKTHISCLLKWLFEWTITDKKYHKCALVYGVNGSGKSLLIDLIAYKFCYNPIHLSIDDERNKEYITKIIKPLLKTKTNINGDKNVLIVSDIDSGSGDYGFMSSLTECIKETNIPIICICDNKFDQSIKPILKYCFEFKLPTPSYDDVYRLVYKIVTEENIKISKSKVDKLYTQSNGDIRYILNALQLNCRKPANDISKNIQSSNIFDTTGQLFNADKSLDEKYNIYWMAHDIHPLMIHENYISCIKDTKNDAVKRLENLSYSIDALCDGDIYSHETWSFPHYTALSCIRATTKCSKKGHIKFSKFLGKTSTMNKNKREKIDYETVNFKSLNM